MRTQTERDEAPETIWKYLLETVSRAQHINLHSGAVLRHVGPDPETEKPTLWFQADTDYVQSPRWFRVVATGTPISKREKFLGSCRCGKYMWHIFETTDPMVDRDLRQEQLRERKK